MKPLKDLEPGDRIICKDIDDMIETMLQLEMHGIETDFNYDDPDTRTLEVISIKWRE